ncbi:MAG: SBBP repeat-containing protein, partial [Actinobacteria bacterium]|nr:SBBP repeat-containing protein [Actinomycetota bacterium]
MLGLVLVVANVDVAGAGTAHLWSKRLGGTDSDHAYSVASDPSGNVLVAGISNNSSIDLGGGPLPGVGSFDMVVAKYSASGTHLWSKRLGGTGFDYAQSVASDPSGNVLVAGYSQSSSIDMGGGPMPGAGRSDMVVAKYSASGTHLWSKRLGGTGFDDAQSVASDPSGNVLVAGGSDSSSIDMGGGPLPGV